MNIRDAIPANDRRAQLILALSALFGTLYLFHDFGLQFPYPFSVVVKTAGIALLGVYALYRKNVVLAAGLFAGSAGDAFLALEPSQIAAGIGAFGIGHLIYVAIFGGILSRNGLRGLPGYAGAAMLIAVGVVLLIFLQPHFGDLRLPASLYNGIIILMAVLALLGRSPGLALAGALLFVVSDTVLALRMFADMLPWGGPVVWVTYYLGQAGIALGLADVKSR